MAEDDVVGREALKDPSITTSTRTTYNPAYRRAQRLRGGLRGFRSKYEKEKGEYQEAATAYKGRIKKFKKKHTPYLKSGLTQFRRKYPARTQKKIATSFKKGTQEIEAKRIAAIKEGTEAKQAQEEYNKRVAEYNKYAAKAKVTSVTYSQKRTKGSKEVKVSQLTPSERLNLRKFGRTEATTKYTIPGESFITGETPAIFRTSVTYKPLKRETFSEKVAFRLSSFAVSKYNPQRSLYIDRSKAGLEMRQRQIYAAVPKTRKEVALEAALWFGPGLAAKGAAKGYRAYKLARHARVTEKVIVPTSRAALAMERGVATRTKAKVTRSTLIPTTIKERVAKTTIKPHFRTYGKTTTYIKEHPRFYKIKKDPIGVTTETGYKYTIPAIARPRKVTTETGKTGYLYRQKEIRPGAFDPGAQLLRIEKAKIGKVKQKKVSNIFGIGFLEPSIKVTTKLRGRPVLALKRQQAFMTPLFAGQAAISKTKSIQKYKQKPILKPVRPRSITTPFVTTRAKIGTKVGSKQALSPFSKLSSEFKTPKSKFKLQSTTPKFMLPPLVPKIKAKKRKKAKKGKYKAKPRKYAYKPSISAIGLPTARGQPRQKAFTGLEIRRVFR